MDDPSKKPLLTANRVIRLFADHLAGEDRILLPADYKAIRIAFRWCKGSWEALVHGNMAHTRLLEALIQAWASLPQAQQHVDVDLI